MIDLEASVTGVSGLISLEVRDGMSQGPVNAEIVASDHMLEVGDTVTITIMGTTLLVGGIVRKIIQKVPEMNYNITVQDGLSQALDYFLVSDNPASPFTVNNIAAEDLWEDILQLAGLTSFTKDATGFTYATVKPVTFNLQSAWSIVETINRSVGFVTYMDNSGVVHFEERRPYIGAGDTVAEKVFSTTGSGDILDIEYERSTQGLANRIVVYGGENNTLFYTAQASSPYLPSGFYKSIVVAHPMIDSMATAVGTANVNLDIFNRLTETVSLKVLGDPAIQARRVYAINEPFTGLTSATKWLAFDVAHRIGPDGYSTSLTLVR